MLLLLCLRRGIMLLLLILRLLWLIRAVSDRLLLLLSRGLSRQLLQGLRLDLSLCTACSDPLCCRPGCLGRWCCCFTRLTPLGW